MVEEKISIKNEYGEELVGILHRANNKKEIVVVCHGFPGHKDRTLIKELCKKLKESNINSFRFDLSGRGESEGEFIETTTTKEIEDIESVINHFKNKGYSISLMGHSRGAMQSLLVGSKNKDIKSIVSISASAYPNNFIERIYSHQREKILKGKHFYWGEEVAGKKYPITPSNVKDLENHKPLEAVKKINIPMLFIHGSEDKSIPVEETKKLHEEANQPKEIKIIENADHNFTNTQHLKEMINRCIKWQKQFV